MKPYAPRYFEVILREDGFDPQWGLMKGNLVARARGFAFFRKAYWRDLLSSAVGFVTHIKGWKVLSRFQMRSLVLALKIFATEIVEDYFREVELRRFPRPRMSPLNIAAEPFIPRAGPSGSDAPPRDSEVPPVVPTTTASFNVGTAGGAQRRRLNLSNFRTVQQALAVESQRRVRDCAHNFGDPVPTDRYRGILNDLRVFSQSCSLCFGIREGIYRLGFWRPDDEVSASVVPLPRVTETSIFLANVVDLSVL